MLLSPPVSMSLVAPVGGPMDCILAVQGITLWRYKREPLWLVATAVARFTDLFTDISYVISAPTLTHLGWIFLLPPPVLNSIGIVIMLLGYQQMRNSTAREG